MGFIIDKEAVVGFEGEEINVVIPTGVKLVSSLEEQKFVSVVVPEGVCWIGRKAFYMCKDLQEVVLPSSLNAIQEWAFYSCESLEKVVIPEGVEKIDRYAFGDCVNLKQITLPKSIKTIHPTAFNGCVNLPKSVNEQISQLQERENFKFALPDLVAKEGIYLYEVTNGEGEKVLQDVALQKRKFSYQEYCQIYEQVRQYKYMESTILTSEGYGDQAHLQELQMRASDIIVCDGNFYGILYHEHTIIKADGVYVHVASSETSSEGYGDYSMETKLALVKR